MKKLQNKLIVASLLVCGFFSLVQAGVSENFEKKASVKVKQMVKKYNLNIVGYDYVLKAIGKGTKKSATSVIIDARPLKKYQMSHIPTALAIPDTKFDILYKDIIEYFEKDKEIIIYCGGFKCTKSPKVAAMLLRKGHKNIKVYAAGMPDWKAKNYVELDTNIAKALFDKKSALFIDARPWGKFARSTIVGSLGVPDTKFDKYAKFMPHDKKAPIVTYCGGYKCGKSHAVARKLVAMGYINVKVYAAGFPAWKKAGYPITGGTKATKAKAKKTVKAQKGYVKSGEDSGTVDGDWFVANYKNFPNSVTIVDVREKEDFESGHITGAINVHAENMKPSELLKAIPSNGDVIFACSTGTRAMEARGFLEEDLKYNQMDRIWYLDANIDCNENNQCSIKPNEPLGI
jgi:rhodanese-related sulfurtransferase